MPRRAAVLALAVLLLLSVSNAPFAQDGAQQKLGLRLFNQSCRVCHTKPQLGSPQYAPGLSMSTLGGNADTVHDVIANGTPRMPGFKYDLKPAEIDAIVAYIRTIPAPQAPAATKPGLSRDIGD
jgi:mono/diheme cytochrome c family protein